MLRVKWIWCSLTNVKSKVSYTEVTSSIYMQQDALRPVSASTTMHLWASLLQLLTTYERQFLNSCQPKEKDECAKKQIMCNSSRAGHGSIQDSFGRWQWAELSSRSPCLGRRLKRNGDAVFPCTLEGLVAPAVVTPWFNDTTLVSCVIVLVHLVERSMVDNNQVQTSINEHD